MAFEKFSFIKMEYFDTWGKKLIEANISYFDRIKIIVSKMYIVFFQPTKTVILRDAS